MLSLQKIVVTTEDWNAVQGTLVCYERISTQIAWTCCKGPFDCVVGAKGMGWGRGIYQNGKKGPVKREGDDKSPAGVFSLRACFGFRPVINIKMNYFLLTPSIEAVDDVHSRYYNEIVDIHQIREPDWNSSEKMAQIDLYKWGVVVNHNYPQPIAGAGSAIFMHVWRDQQSGTAGCTAMAPEHMEEICKWLNQSKHPVLMQAPHNILQDIDRI